MKPIVTITMTTSTSNCLICDEKFNKRRNQPIQCEFCNFEACMNCCETYLKTSLRAKCMNNSCDKEWTNKFIRKCFTDKFISGELKAHRESILFDREIALLPETQPFVEYILNTEKQVCTLMNELIELRKNIGTDDESIEEYIKNVKAMELRISKMNDRLFSLKQRISKRRQVILPTQEEIEANEDLIVPKRNSVRNYTRNCLSETCHGFLNNQWKCGICSTQFCKDCHEIKSVTDTHSCNPETVATVSLMRTDTKPCPNCHFGIFKIDGCDLMWCTQCNTAFSWRTGEIRTSNIHNPHYFEWRRTHGALERQPQDILCGREINIHEINSIQRKHKLKDDQKKDGYKFLELCRYLMDYQARNREPPRRACTQTLRIQYLMKELTKAKFKMIIQREDKANNVEVEMFNITEFLFDILQNIVLRFIEDIKSEDWNGKFPILKEIDEIIKYSNDLLKEVSVTYKTCRYKIDIYRFGLNLMRMFD